METAALNNGFLYLHRAATNTPTPVVVPRQQAKTACQQLWLSALYVSINS
jgi:hypothetical protein